MVKHQVWRMALVIVVSVSAGAEESAPSPPTPPEEVQATLADGEQWKLVWHDEFEGTSIDETKWEIVGDIPRRDAFWVKADSFVDGSGNLVLQTSRDGDRFTSGAVRTQGRFEHKYGYWEARCKFPSQLGHWPAFWLFSRPGVEKVGNQGRDGTEIDIMEKPSLESSIQHALHWDGYGEDHQSDHRVIDTPGLNEGFHTFGLLWTPDAYVFFVDGKKTWRTDSGGVSQVPAFIKLTEEIGPWAGDIKEATLPDRFLVDYVRVWDAAEMKD